MAKVQSKGIFVGAKVARGPDWDWGNQDGKYIKNLNHKYCLLYLITSFM